MVRLSGLESKSDIRQRITVLRDAVSPEQRAEWSRAICQRAIELPAYTSAKVIHCFLSMRSEIDSTDLIQHALAHRKRVAIPHFVRNHAETPCLEITTLDDAAFAVSGFGLRIPRHKVPLAPEQIDVAFVPLLAFAISPISVLSRIEAQPKNSIINGTYHRVGYGAGYYDRFLVRLRADAAKLGLAFALQQVNRFEIEAFDVPLDLVITEKR